MGDFEENELIKSSDFRRAGLCTLLVVQLTLIASAASSKPDVFRSQLYVRRHNITELWREARIYRIDPKFRTISVYFEARREDAYLITRLSLSSAVDLKTFYIGQVIWVRESASAGGAIVKLHPPEQTHPDSTR